MSTRQYLITLSLILCSLNSDAVNTSSGVALTINSINFYSKQESIYPSHKGLLQITFITPITWNNSGNCGSTSVLVRNEDNHIISALLSANAASTPIRLYADDTLKVGQECYLRTIGL